jgi:hypothetical protein
VLALATDVILSGVSSTVGVGASVTVVILSYVRVTVEVRVLATAVRLFCVYSTLGRGALNCISIAPERTRSSELLAVIFLLSRRE